ncbi:sulfotransferase [Psychroserpens sp. XS_ASV72]|uniref:sulfotransferase family protein n=1 Tax=Psychroserpens sp. XS_ASV72 TaxID=3241293 RepID=UPI0035177801
MKFSNFNKTLIFIIGSGRSGTHLLGRTFENSSEIDAFIEDERFFKPITNLAVGINKNQDDFKSILKAYKKAFKRSKKDYILEKTHPNIWFVEEILEAFPNAKFVGIKRNVFSTVSSMLNHNGVLSWYEKLPLDEPNRFLGITESNKSDFVNLPMESKCAIRCLAHYNRLNELQQKFPDNVLVVDYEEFYDAYDQLMEKLQSFLNLDFKLNSEPLNPSGKDKWKRYLTDIQIKHIEQIIEESHV